MGRKCRCGFPETRSSVLDGDGGVWCPSCIANELSTLRAELERAERQRDELLDAMEQGPFRYWGVPERIRGEINDEVGE